MNELTVASKSNGFAVLHQLRSNVKLCPSSYGFAESTEPFFSLAVMFHTRTRLHVKRGGSVPGCAIHNLVWKIRGWKLYFDRMSWIRGHKRSVHYQRCKGRLGPVRQLLIKRRHLNELKRNVKLAYVALHIPEHTRTYDYPPRFHISGD